MSGLAEVAEWQTRRSQTPLIARSCGFESHLRHQAPGAAPGIAHAVIDSLRNAVAVL